MTPMFSDWAKGMLHGTPLNRETFDAWISIYEGKRSTVVGSRHWGRSRAASIASSLFVKPMFSELRADNWMTLWRRFARPIDLRRTTPVGSENKNTPGHRMKWCCCVCGATHARPTGRGDVYTAAKQKFYDWKDKHDVACAKVAVTRAFLAKWSLSLSEADLTIAGVLLKDGSEEAFAVLRDLLVTHSLCYPPTEADRP
jgi:hypothetical protein